MALLAVASPIEAQQVFDSTFHVTTDRPQWRTDAGPLVLVDQAHHNGQVLGGEIEPLAGLLRSDGYRVAPLADALSADAIGSADIIVIVDALATQNVDNWVLPTPSAFSDPEMDALVSWVRRGGGLFLVADHMPFAGAASDLARRFGVTTLNGFAIDTLTWDPIVFRRSDGTLRESPMTIGVDSVATFWGHAFRSDTGTSVMTFGPTVISYQPQRAWRFNEGTDTVAVAGWAQAIAEPFGRGRVVLLGDSGMLSAHRMGPHQNPQGLNAPAASQNALFLLNTFHWLAASGDH